MESVLPSLMLDRETKASERPGDHKDELRLWLRMLTCSTLIETEIRNRLREEFKTTLPRFDLMAQLDKSSTGMTVGEVSQRLMVSNGNVTAVVAGLLADGLVDKRAATQDRRVQVLTLTAQGRKAFKAMAERHEGWIAELFAGLDQPDIGQLFRLLGNTKTSLHRAISARSAQANDAGMATPARETPDDQLRQRHDPAAGSLPTAAFRAVRRRQGRDRDAEPA